MSHVGQQPSIWPQWEMPSRLSEPRKRMPKVFKEKGLPDLDAMNSINQMEKV